MTVALIAILLPSALFVLMFGMGLSLTLKDFYYIKAEPKLVLVGVVGQMVLLPLVGLLLLSVIKLDPVVAIGFLVLCFCPGGATSNLYTYISKGNVALSVSLTTITCFIQPITLPIIVSYVLAHYAHTDTEFTMPVIQTIAKLFGISVVPIFIGMLFRYKNDQLSLRLIPYFEKFSIAFLVAITCILFAKNMHLVIPYLKEAGIITIALNISTLVIALVLATVFATGRESFIAYSYELGIQNVTTSLYITVGILASEKMGIVPMIYGISSMVFALSLYLFFKMKYSVR